MSEDRDRSLLEQLTRLTGQVAGQTLDMARSTAAMALMFGENRLGSTVLKTLEPERLEAMADAGHFLRDARETAGMSLRELADALGVKDDNLLEDIESIIHVEALHEVSDEVIDNYVSAQGLGNRRDILESS